MTQYQLLDLIRRRPAMYFGCPSLAHLRAFVDGYFFCAWQAELVVLAETPDFGGFNDWVAAKLGYAESTSGWSNMIAAQRSSQDTALRLFYQLLDEYRGLHPRMLAQAVISQHTAASFMQTAYPNLPEPGVLVAVEVPRLMLTIEEVLPANNWVQLLVKADNIILDAWGPDDVEAAMEYAHNIFNVAKSDWILNS